MLFKFITVLILCTPACLSQIIGKRCSDYNVKVVQNFNLTEYLGKWYEYERYEAIFQLGYKCVTADYSKNEEGNVTVVNAGRIPFFNFKTSITGVAYPVDPDSKEAKLKVSFFEIFPSGDYWVIGTDYKNYSVVWSCGLRFQFLWVLVRNLDVSDEIKSTVNKIMDDAGIDRSKLRKTRTDRRTCGTY